MSESQDGGAGLTQCLLSLQQLPPCCVPLGLRDNLSHATTRALTHAWGLPTFKI